MASFFFGVSLFLCLSFTSLALAEHQTADIPVMDTTHSKGPRAEGEARAASSTLRKALIDCADGIGALQPSKDYADFLVDAKGKPYVNLFHESGSYIVPLDAEKLHGGSYQAFVSFPTNRDRKEKILLTISIADVKKLEGISVRTTIPVVQDQNPRNLDMLNAISAVLEDEDKKNSASENHFLDTRLVPNVGADLQSKAKAVATKPIQIDNIFEDVNFVLDIQKATEKVLKSPDLDLKKLYADVYNKYDKEIRFKEETQKAVDKLADEMSAMMAALKICAKTPNKMISGLSENLSGRLAIAKNAHGQLQRIIAGYVAEKIKGMNEKKFTSVDAGTLKTVQDSIANGIIDMYSKARIQLQEKR